MVSFGLLSFTVKNEVIDTEMEIALEEWMLSPFTAMDFEAELVLEDWMVAPFKENLLESEKPTTSRIPAPSSEIHTEANISLESWMTEAWF